ncbi:CHAP domain-containing protein [Amycolatopsis vancoresmycina]|uniref:CHAP domain-containing protein n=1 Tax=Amycolatopsis vancoresmycina TaxID=208444 RepID=UPI0005275A74|nr:CHAP domain-containing protein [Amycolatopsis vancoresmycina]
MSSSHNRTTLRPLAGLITVVLSGATLLGPGAASAAAATGAQIVSIADANLGKGYCSTNSAGGTGFDSSCSANNGAGEFWCGDFVAWVWQQAGVSVPAASPASVPSWINTSAYHSLSSGYVPQPGDAVVFGDDTYPTEGSHIAIVTDYSNGLLSDIGGDEGGGQPGGNGNWWSTSSVKVDEGNGAAWNPHDKLFAGQSYEMWVLGYVSSGAGQDSGSTPLLQGGTGLTADTTGGFATAWQGRDANNSLWVATGAGTTLSAYGDPYALGVAANSKPSIATLSDGSWVAAWQGRDANNSLWIATGKGNTITSFGDPYLLGVAPNTSPSIVALPNKQWEVAWQGRDANNSLWLATGTGASITAKGDPWALGVAAPPTAIPTPWESPRTPARRWLRCLVAASRSPGRAATRTTASGSPPARARRSPRRATRGRWVSRPPLRPRCRRQQQSRHRHPGDRRVRSDLEGT